MGGRRQPAVVRADVGELGEYGVRGELDERGPSVAGVGSVAVDEGQTLESVDEHRDGSGREQEASTAAGITGLAGLLTAAFFDVGVRGVAAVTIWSTAWLLATSVAVRRARAHRIRSHRAWMTRSYALALVFRA